MIYILINKKNDLHFDKKRKKKEEIEAEIIFILKESSHNKIPYYR